MEKIKFMGDFPTLKRIKYAENEKWKEIFINSLRELEKEIHELESEILKDEFNEDTVFSIIDELKDYLVYLEDGVDRGFLE